MTTQIVYNIMSAATAVLAVLAVFSARKAMHRGLTYSAVAVTVWTLTFLAIARVVHVTREVFELEAVYGQLPEMVEYVFSLIGYSVFVWLTHRSELLRAQDKKA